MTSLQINRAFEMRVPHNIPHVSRLARVFGSARERKLVRRDGGRKTVRRKVPFSSDAEYLNVKAEILCDEELGDFTVPMVSSVSPSVSCVISGDVLFSSTTVSRAFGGGSGGCVTLDLFKEQSSLGILNRSLEAPL